MSALAFAAVAQPSPFLLKVERVAAAAASMEIRVSVSVPDKHVLYADTFKVLAGAGAVVEGLQIPPPANKPAGRAVSAA